VDPEAQVTQSRAPKATIQYLALLLQLVEDLVPFHPVEVMLAVLAVLVVVVVTGEQQVQVTHQVLLPHKVRLVALVFKAVLIMAQAAAVVQQVLVGEATVLMAVMVAQVQHQVSVEAA
jgi:hypothetical protein